MALTWSKKAFPNGGPQSWTDFFDTAKFPGPRSLPDTGDREWWVPLAALLADGVAPDKAFPMDIDRAYKKLDALKAADRRLVGRAATTRCRSCAAAMP